MITVKKVIEQVRKIAKENPDFVYTNQGDVDAAEYSYLGRSMSEPNVGQGCIVGQALLDLGVTREEMVEAGIEGTTASEALMRLGINSGSMYSQYLDFVQDMQDIGEPWGRAVEFADNVE